MKHEEIQELLEDYVDELLDRPTRKLVDDHLQGCSECRAILDDVAPVDLAAIGGGVIDERMMRRTVRRSIARTAVNAALLLLAGFIAVWLLSALLLQPLLINRGGRASELARASIDIPAMTNPGAVLDSGTINSDLLSRKVDLRFAIPVGASLKPAFDSTTSIEIFDIHNVIDNSADRPINDSGFYGDSVDQLRNLGSGTVATVNVWFDNAFSMDEAQQLADDPGADIRVVWAGFDVSDGQVDSPSWTTAGTLGYATCQTGALELDESLLGATSAGFGQGSMGSPSSIAGALQSVQRSLDNIAESTELTEYLMRYSNDDPAQLDAVMTVLANDPKVRQLVVTGPSPEIADFLGILTGQSVSANVLAVDFYNWAPGICGR